MIKRTLDPTFLNSVANHPEVRPWLMGEGPLDLSPIISSPGNIALQAEHGGWVLQCISPAVYEVHSMFLPEGRGANVKAALAEALDYVFSATDCRQLVTRIPVNNPSAAALGKIAGFRPWFGDRYRIEVEDWAQSSKACLDAGEWFHDRLEAVKKEQGSALEVHEDDPGHDHAVGAAVLMCKSGNAAKAVWHYNAWAAAAGYSPITLVSVNPMVIDVVDAVLEGPNMEVLLCR